MSSSIRKCLLCGNEYEYCPSCGHKMYDLWKVNFCSQNCKDIFQSIADFNCGSKNEEELKEVLSKLDLSNKENYKTSVKEILNKVYEDKASLETKTVAEEVKVTNTVPTHDQVKENVSYSRNKYVKTKYGKR